MNAMLTDFSTRGSIKVTLEFRAARRSVPGFLALFFLVVAVLSATKIPCIWTGVEKIVAVGDLHGDYENFVKILKGTGLVNRELHWTGGKTHLVQMGDVMDKGPEAKKILDLLMSLEKEAEDSGGRVHALIGNHEEVNITGIAFDYPGYVMVEQFVSFLPDKLREKKEREFRKKALRGAPPGSKPLVGSVESFRGYWEETIKNDSLARKEYLRNFNERYGKWILQHNAVIKINDVIFVHGGISERFSKWTLEDLNAVLRRELDLLRLILMSSVPLPPDLSLEVVYQSDGPLWYRELAVEDEIAYQQDVETILSNLGAKYMVIAHTPIVIHTKAEMSRFQGKVWIIDTGISRVFPGGHQSALIIENENFSIWGVPNGQQDQTPLHFFEYPFSGSPVFRF
jgi:hypothetical protein